MRDAVTVALVLALAGCASTNTNFAERPTPDLCRTMVETKKYKIWYDDLVAELNKRGEDCKEYILADMSRDKNQTTVNQKVEVNR